MGYEVVEGEAPKVVEKKELPKMPSEDALMKEDEWRKSTCPICKGRTHPIVAEELGFETSGSYALGRSGIAHNMCIALEQIKKTKADLKREEQSLQKDDLYRQIQAGKTTLDDINNKSHALYKDELERRKQAWRDKNLPKESPKAESAVATETKEEWRARKAKVEELIHRKPLASLLKRLQTEQPKLVPSKPDYWDAFRRYSLGEEGWTDHRTVAKAMGLKSHGSVQRQFQKIDTALAELQ